jgi:serine/threonine protein kinase
MIGQTLGPYQIIEKLGEGGMGEVYRARDTRLDRDVAIKVLASSASWSAEARARFEREARPSRNSAILTSVRSSTLAA